MLIGHTATEATYYLAADPVTTGKQIEDSHEWNCGSSKRKTNAKQNGSNEFSFAHPFFDHIV